MTATPAAASRSASRPSRRRGRRVTHARRPPPSAPDTSSSGGPTTHGNGSRSQTKCWRCARRAGDAVLELQARTWRIVDLDELGDGAALEAELDAYADTAARARLTAYAWWVPAWRSARAYLAGHLAEGERLAPPRGRARPQGRRPERRLRPPEPLGDRASPTTGSGSRSSTSNGSGSGSATPRPDGRTARCTCGCSLRPDSTRTPDASSRRSGPPSVPRAPGRVTRTGSSAAKELSEAAVLLDERELAAELETAARAVRRPDGRLRARPSLHGQRRRRPRQPRRPAGRSEARSRLVRSRDRAGGARRRARLGNAPPPSARPGPSRRGRG